MRPALEKIVWVASLAVLAWFYGFFTSERQWFPSALIERASEQAQAILPITSPVYLHDRFYDHTGARTIVPGEVQPGLTLVSTVWSTSDGLTPGLRLIDRQGEVWHKWKIDLADVFEEPTTLDRLPQSTDIHGSYLFPSGSVLVNVEYAGTLRLDACGNVIWRLAVGSHHSISRSEDGNFWIPAVTPTPRIGSHQYPDGHPGMVGPVYQDLILQVAEDGTVLDTINVLDVLYTNGLEWHLADEEQQNDIDPTHLNDVEPLPSSLADQYPLFETGDLGVSLRDLDLVFVMDPRSERIRWHSSKPFIKQHDPDFIGNGWITIFDNRWDGTARGTMLGGSRILAVHPQTDSMKVLFPTSESDPFYTSQRGNSQMLANGNPLLTESETGRVLKVDADGRTLWEWVTEPHGDSQVPSVSESMRIDMSREDVTNWPCSPSTPAEAETGP